MTTSNRVKLATTHRRDLVEPEPFGDDPGLGWHEREVGVGLGPLARPPIGHLDKIDYHEVFGTVKRRNEASIFAPPGRPSR